MVIMKASPAGVAGPRSMPLPWAERRGPPPEPAEGPALSCVENTELEADERSFWVSFQSPSF